MEFCYPPENGQFDVVYCYMLEVGQLWEEEEEEEEEEREKLRMFCVMLESSRGMWQSLLMVSDLTTFFLSFSFYILARGRLAGWQAELLELYYYMGGRENEIRNVESQRDFEEKLQRSRERRKIFIQTPQGKWEAQKVTSRQESFLSAGS